MKIALAQINPKVGDMRQNTSKIISIIKNTHAELIVFPELSITGYSPQDLLFDNSFINENINALAKIVKSSEDKSAVIGFIEKKDKKLFNSAALISNKKIIGIHHKKCLPNYTIFDEKRWFNEGNVPGTFTLHGKALGISICEDIWFPETVKLQKKKGAEAIINISASPYSKGKIRTVEDLLNQRWEEAKIPIVYVNQAGAQDGIVYYGHSIYFNHGKIAAKCRDFEEDIQIIEVNGLI